MDSKGRYQKTEIDIRSQELCEVLMEIHRGVEGLDLLRSPPVDPGFSTPTERPKALHRQKTSMFGLVLRDTSERCFWDSPGTLSYTFHTILFLVFMTLGDAVRENLAIIRPRSEDRLY